MIKKIAGYFDAYVICLMATVVIASLFPAQGFLRDAIGVLAKVAIVLLFFLHGAKLPLDVVISGVRNWRLHITILAITFVVFPLVTWPVMEFAPIAGQLAFGFMFLAILPSTVQSSIAFTSMAGGNVASAIFAASFSNVVGIFATPALVALLLHSDASYSADAVGPVIYQLLLPFAAGQILRPVIGNLVQRHKKLTMLVDRGSILLVVYSAFAAAVLEGLWRTVSPADLGYLVVLCLAILAVMLALTWYGGIAMGFSREDRIVLLFCGSKKSLASGVPMAGVLFPAAQVGILILPLMIFHQIQLIACAVIARRLAGSNPPERPAVDLKGNS